MEKEQRILIVDDERIVCERLGAEMTRAGYLVETFTESSAAIQYLEQQRVDVVITDIKMRGPSGIEVMRYVNEHYPSTKVIVITGFATIETAREVLKGGAVDFIPKPFKMRDLRKLVARILHESGTAPETS
jgi:DNA-binding NtrC family response regulator